MPQDWNERPLDRIVGYTEGMTLPVETTKQNRQWHPSEAFLVRPTEDAHWAWFFTKAHAAKVAAGERLWDKRDQHEARMESARRIVHRLIEQGTIDMTDITGSDLDRAETALAFAVGLVNDVSVDMKTRLAASAQVLTFCRAKPAQKSEVTINAAESFLDSIGD